MKLIKSASLESLLLMTLATLVSEGCFIRNCPLGGRKRSLLEYFAKDHRMCSTCDVELSGERVTGICVTSELCCLRNYGCFSDLEVTNSCRDEDLIPMPCLLKGKPCGTDGAGTCVTKGICCDDEGSCRLDGECSHS